jgi:HlyD family secretion protein
MAERFKKVSSFIKRRRSLLIGVFVLAAVGIGAALYFGNKASAGDYLTAKAERTNVEVTVSATGTVQAVTTVQVGSQVSGTVLELGADFNTNVKRGQVIAKLDPAIIQAQVENQRASVENSKAAVQNSQTEILNQDANVKAAAANLRSAEANLDVTRVQRDDAQDLVKRNEELRRKNVISDRDLLAAKAQANAAAARYDQAAAQVGQVKAAAEAAKARREQANSSLAQSKAQLMQSEAQLRQSQANLEHTIITSPIDGVVVSRNVDVGQTVAASLQAPTLFTIANDLTKMQVIASIDEADVGQIKQGIQANFTVDAFPGETFRGEITQLRLNAQTLQNVVTYSAVIEVANPELKLRPGMTTNITIPVAKRDNVLAVPNAALRFKPSLSEEEMRQKMEAYRNKRQAERQAQGGQPAEQGRPNREGQPQGEGAQQAQSGQPGQGGQGSQGGGEGGQRRQGQMVWVLVGDKQIEPRFVRTGLTNGRMTEILGGDLQEGETIVIGQNDANGNSRQPQTGTPFGQRPPMGGGRPR